MIKKTLLILLLVPMVAVIAIPSGIFLHVDTYQVDTKASKIEWFAEKVTGKHNGTINLSSGQLYNNHGKFSGKFVMDMNSIAVADLTGEYKGKLENHLKSDDFFGVKKHPTAEFEITLLDPLSGDENANFTVTGNLTIKAITHEISFPAMIRFEGRGFTATGEAVIDRSKFNVRYGSKSFFSDIGDKAIYDNFKLKLNLVASM